MDVLYHFVRYNRHMSQKTLALIALIVASLLWSTAGVTAKILVKDMHPFVVAFYRFFIASILILPFFLREKKAWLNWKQLLIPSFIGALNVPLFFYGIKTTTANSATLIYTAGPLTTAILSYILIREKNSLSKWIGIFVGLIGVCIIIILPVIEKGEMMAGSFQGNLFIAVGMLSWTLYAIWSRRIRALNQFSPVTTTSFYFFLATLTSFILVLLTKQQFFTPQVFQPSYIFVLAYSAIFLTIITYFLFQWAIEHLSATTASFKQYIETVFAVVLNFLLLGEKLTYGLIAGGLLVLTGVAIATIGKIRRGAPVQSRTAITASGGPRSIH